MSNKKFLIITSIFEPTEAVKKFAEIDGWQLVVVGDKKTPAGWQYPNVTYLGPEDQEKLGYSILRHLPWNHYCRKMVGYLYAMSQGADIIADSDDDNIPMENWPSLPQEAVSRPCLSGQKFVNIYKYFTDAPVWPRGFPLPLLTSKDKPTTGSSSEDDKVGVWQFLANEDPDVDAIYRLVDNTPIYFKESEPIVLAKGTVCPFNSQNTFFHKQFFPLLYLPAFVTFRFTDILRGLTAQPLLWSEGYNLGFGQATVVQKRNPHDYLRDFESEIPVYLYSEKVIDIANDTLRQTTASTLPEKLLAVYEALLGTNIVTSEEITLLRAWCEDLAAVTSV
jgi:hypothetical protein